LFPRFKQFFFVEQGGKVPEIEKVEREREFTAAASSFFSSTFLQDTLI
jgi:hypothetical protein